MPWEIRQVQANWDSGSPQIAEGGWGLGVRKVICSDPIVFCI